jgi:hypothetical protein
MEMKSKITQLVLALALALTAGLASAAGASAQPLAASPGAAASHAAKFTPAQLAEMQLRVGLANTIVKNVGADAAAKGLDGSWRLGLLNSLFAVPSASLSSIAASATTVDQAHALSNAALSNAHSTGSLAKSLGSATDSLVYTPMTPCRFIDTRNVGGAITTPRDFDTEFFGGSYGGASSCTLPFIGEPAFVANVTVVVPNGPAGFLGIRPFGNTDVTSFINWETGGTTGLANAGVITTAFNGTSHYAFNVFQGGGNAPQFILDYQGYFSPAIKPVEQLDCYSSGPGPVTITANSNTFWYVVACSAGYQLVGLDCYNNGHNGIYSGGQGYTSGSATGDGFCQWINVNSSAQIVRQNGICCRVPAGF